MYLLGLGGWAELVSVLLVVSTTGGTSHTYLLIAGPELLIEGLGQAEFPESSLWARPGQPAVGQVVLVLKGLMCEWWGPNLVLAPLCQPCRKLPCSSVV